jgi:hypothetical protein
MQIIPKAASIMKLDEIPISSPTVIEANGFERSSPEYKYQA